MSIAPHLFTEFFLYFELGAIHFFKKMMNIGYLEIGDYLGIFDTFLFFFFCGVIIFSILIFIFSMFTLFTSLNAAIGAIFSATDSVCTLQVLMVWKL